jgi:hypothetical protein
MLGSGAVMVKAALIGGTALVAAGVALTLRGFAGWAFLALAAGFTLALGPLVKRALVRYGGAVAAAVMTLALLMPLAPEPSLARRADPTPTVGSALPTREPEGSRSPPSAVGGPADEVRRAIFRELVAAGERAQREASATHPDQDAGGAVSDAERAAKRAEKRVRLARLLEQRYRKEIAARYGVPEESLPEVLEEGRRQGWAAEAP